MTLLQMDHVHVTAISQTLAQLGVTINASLTRIALFPNGAVRYQLNGSAVTSGAPIPDQGISIPMDAATSALLQFASQGYGLTVQQYG
jgi:hypothetical protein